MDKKTTQKSIGLEVINAHKVIIEFLMNKKQALLDISEEEIINITRYFMHIYNQKPIENNIGGCSLMAVFILFIVATWLKPKLIIESGVWRGQTTWILRQACPPAEIYAFDISLKNLVYKDNSAQYFQHDWILSDILNKDPNRGLAFFDDHINQCQRVREAYERKFKWLIFDDNVPRHKLSHVGKPPFPTIAMLYDTTIKEGDVIHWKIKGQQFSYVYSVKETFGARELVEDSLVFPTNTCLTLVKLKSP